MLCHALSHRASVARLYSTIPTHPFIHAFTICNTQSFVATYVCMFLCCCYCHSFCCCSHIHVLGRLSLFGFSQLVLSGPFPPTYQAVKRFVASVKRFLIEIKRSSVNVIAKFCFQFNVCVCMYVCMQQFLFIICLAMPYKSHPMHILSYMSLHYNPSPHT